MEVVEAARRVAARRGALADAVVAGGVERYSTSDAPDAGPEPLEQAEMRTKQQRSGPRMTRS